MGITMAHGESWSSGDAYERYVGRWSRMVAREFIRWLAVPENKQWLDVGCGTGALSQIIFETQKPNSIKGIDRSEDHVKTARRNLNHPNAEFETGDAQSLSVESDSVDVAVSGLVLNFVPQHERMVAEMKRVVRRHGIVALYVWDYAAKVQFMRHFWNAVAALDPAARELDEGTRFPICDPNGLLQLFQEAGLAHSEARGIEISTHFKDFDDFWMPFLGGQGPGPGYVMFLSEERRAQLRERIYSSLPFAVDGSIPLVARAWAIKGFNL